MPLESVYANFTVNILSLSHLACWFIRKLKMYLTQALPTIFYGLGVVANSLCFVVMKHMGSWGKDELTFIDIGGQQPSIYGGIHLSSVNANTFCLLSFFIIAVDQDASFLKDDDDNTTTTTTEATTTTTTTEATTTTTEATTTTTEATTTTTTTEATTTTTEPTTTTPAPEPTPEPTPAPAPTPTPAPKPTPTPGTWTVFDADTNTTCVVAKMAASFLVPYLSLDGVSISAI